MPPKEWREANGYTCRIEWLSQAEDCSMRQAYAYEHLMGRKPPEPLNYPEWKLKPKEWLAMNGLDMKKTAYKPKVKRQASLSPLELVAQARKDRDAANKAFASAVRAAVVAGESAGRVGSAAGITRQRVYQIAS